MDGANLLWNHPEKVDLILTSPPYDNQRAVDFTFSTFIEMAAACHSALKPGGTLVWIVADGHRNFGDTLTSFRQGQHFQDISFNVNVQIYRILNPKPNPQRKTPTKDFEYIFVCYKGRPKTTNWIEVPSKHAGKPTGGSNGRQQGYEKTESRVIKDMKRHSTTWEYLVGQSWSENATPFPLQLARDVIVQYSKPGDLVIDPMCGSGTTAVGCVIEKRNFVMGDLDLKRVHQTRKAIADATRGLYLGATCPYCGGSNAIYKGKDGFWKTRCATHDPFKITNY